MLRENICHKPTRYALRGENKFLPHLCGDHLKHETCLPVAAPALAANGYENEAIRKGHSMLLKGLLQQGVPQIDYVPSAAFPFYHHLLAGCFFH